jgi:regulator of ribonuclease activity A
MSFKTADLCDEYSETLEIAEPLFKDFGVKPAFYGRISTVRCFEDNSLVRSALETEGKGGVLVVDGGGSRRCALMGDQLALLAERNGWAGAIINGCIRDSADIATLDIGLKALGTHPLKSNKQGLGERDVNVRFAGVTFIPGHFVYADPDGILVTSKSLLE